MSTEINTRGALSKYSNNFWTGNDSECLSKQEIQSAGVDTVGIAGSYGSAECVVLDDITVTTWEYEISCSEPSITFPKNGGRTSFSITSTKQKKVNGVNSGNPVTVDYKAVISGSFKFSLSGNTVIADTNYTSNYLEGQVTVTQNESGYRTIIHLVIRPTL